MKCDQLETHWEAWLEGTAPAELEQHLRECPRCRQVAGELRRTTTWVGLLLKPPHEPGPAFWARLEERLAASDRDANFWATLSWAASRMVLALALLVLLVTAWMVATPSRQVGVAEIDLPPSEVQAAAVIPPAEGTLNRDQVVLTLVAQKEPQQ